ncbi:MAG: hypothetical protein IH835_08095 [Proteobacteria bacterium]|nr:hypothetical protein [Pseudomonadota bacterium]
MDAALSDGVASAISIAHGLLFELVPEPWDPSNLFRNTNPRIFPSGSMQPPENTLVARELHARDRVWALGAGASRPPHEMIFTSTPLAVSTGAGDALLVTYRDGQDFYAGLLDPFDDGNELKRVYLCTMTPDFLDVPDLLPPAADDQFAYIPTNAGLLLAVNLGDLSLRWASRYERRTVQVRNIRRQRSAPAVVIAIGPAIGRVGQYFSVVMLPRNNPELFDECRGQAGRTASPGHPAAPGQ